jgi:hypothetical protein
VTEFSWEFALIAVPAERQEGTEPPSGYDTWKDAYLAGDWPVEPDLEGPYVRLGEKSGLTAVQMPKSILYGIEATERAKDLMMLTDDGLVTAFYQHLGRGRRLDRDTGRRMRWQQLQPKPELQMLMQGPTFREQWLDVTVLADDSIVPLPVGEADRRWRYGSEGNAVHPLPDEFHTIFTKPTSSVLTRRRHVDAEPLPGGLCRRGEVTQFVAKPDANVALLMAGLVLAGAGVGPVTVLDYDADIWSWWRAMRLKDPDGDYIVYTDDPPSLNEVRLSEKTALLIVHSIIGLCSRDGLHPRSPRAADYVETMRRLADTYHAAVVFTDCPPGYRPGHRGVGAAEKTDRSHVSWYVSWNSPIYVPEKGSGEWGLDLNKDSASTMPRYRTLEATVDETGRVDVPLL